ncbi:LOW QUALITY PROTEIN: hypothetical protein ACHAW5_010265 [Stephanodiscus triporus]|uniref:Peptidase S1 domain-containing protein n=1 Tax=Stephanodiscus triporus TaxID=2934178 RepID=A0ABD3N0L8_9STRA
MTSQIISASLILLGVTSSLCSANLFDTNAAGSLRGAENRIIDGEETEENEYPFVVSLQDSMGHFCGGSLIAKNVVLSAAHCQGGDYAIALGRHDRMAVKFEKFARELPHEDYDADTTDYDYMLIFLEEPADLSAGVGLVRLNNDPESPLPGDEVVVIGWGVTDTDTGELSDVLMEVSVNVISNDECEDSKDDMDSYKGQITENMLCARDNGEDSCQGDSGGPLVSGDAETGYTQMGTVSWGIGCADPNFPGVYSRISQAYNWIACEVCNEDIGYAEEAGFNCDNVPTNCGSIGSGGGGGGGGGGGSQSNSATDDENESSLTDGVLSVVGDPDV